MINTLDDNDMCRPVIRLKTGEPGSERSARMITGPVTVLGSGGGCDMVLASSSVDEAHAVIVRLGGGAFVCDLGAPGGTQVNGATYAGQGWKTATNSPSGPITFSWRSVDRPAPSRRTRDLSR